MAIAGGVASHSVLSLTGVHTDYGVTEAASTWQVTEEGQGEADGLVRDPRDQEEIVLGHLRRL